MDGKENEKLLKCCCALDFCDLVMINFFSIFSKLKEAPVLVSNYLERCRNCQKCGFLCTKKELNFSYSASVTRLYLTFQLPQT